MNCVEFIPLPEAAKMNIMPPAFAPQRLNNPPAAGSPVAGLKTEET